MARTHLTDLSAAARRRLLRLESQERARQLENEVVAGLAETRTLSEARGSEVHQPKQGRGEARKPMRRLSGLVWLHGKGRITNDQFAAGERYGAAYRRTKSEPSLRSILNRDVTNADGPTLAQLIDHATATHQARQKLDRFRLLLSHQTALVLACDMICGEQKTPREACSNGQDAAAMESVLIVALDLLNARYGEPQTIAA